VLAGRYRVTRQLGRGGMGVVYQADDLRLGHAVALKFLTPALAADPHRLAQFHNEVSIARQVSHPNVCRVYDIGDADGHLFLSMEYVDGLDLAAHLNTRGALAEDAAVDVIRGVCAGLAAVHARGVLHRDLKPANIMMTTGGQPKLMDSGIAAAGDNRDERRSEGSPTYMAPEQLAGSVATTKSDIYALGLVMFETLTGTRGVTAGTVDELIRVQEDLPSEISRRLPRVSARLRQAIAQCLAPDPAARPGSALEVASLLQTVILDERATARRWFQLVVQGGTTPLLIVGGGMVLRENGVDTIVGSLMLLTAIALVAIELRYPLGWQAVYKGHVIGFRNHPLFGERLYVDGELVDRGRFGRDVVMRATFERGAGAGERLTAHVQSSVSFLSCRIVAESFASGA
jgi:serine/threonine protein kinase